MLHIEIPEKSELWDEESEQFVSFPGVSLKLEHSLLSISKWESIWKIAFLKNDPPKTAEQTLSYIKCMTLNQAVPKDTYRVLSSANINDITEYIHTDQTATWFSDEPKKSSRNSQIVTSELIYYWMVAAQIPFEAQKWHLSRLLTLIRIYEIKSNKEKKMSKGEVMKRNAALNAARRKATQSNG